MHEEADDDEELGRHHDQQRRQEQRPDVDVGQRHLGGGDHGEDQGDDDVLLVGRPVLVVAVLVGREVLAGVVRVSVLIGASSCRDQVDEREDDDPDDVDEVPVEADELDDLGPVAGRPGSREIMPTSASSMMMPTVTWTPWKPVSV